MTVARSPQDGLFYLEGFISHETTWETLDFETLAPLIEAVAFGDLEITPLLSVAARNIVPPAKDPPELKYLGPVYVRLWTQDLALRKTEIERHAEDYIRRGLTRVKNQQALIKVLHERGVVLVPGSASPHPWLFPGRALHQELRLWAQAGISTHDVLRLATSGAADALGVAGQRGRLIEGHIADIVVCDLDPHETLATLETPHLVCVRGRPLERAELDGMLSDLAATQKRLRAAAETPIEVSPPELPEGEVLLIGRVETSADGLRISAERYAVVRELDGLMSYLGRMRTPGAASYPETELAIRQSFRDGRLESFLVQIHNGGRRVAIRGQREAAQLKIERSVDGESIDDVELVETPAFVDAGSVTALLVLGREVPPGSFRAMFFEDTEPAVGNYELALDDDATHLLRGPDGDRIVRFAASGNPEQAIARRGTAIVELRSTEVDTFGGKGLTLPPDKAPKKKGRRPQKRSKPVEARAEGEGEGAKEDGRQ